MKQVRYFEAMYLGAITKHYTKDTEDFVTYVNSLELFDKSMAITYISFDDGTTVGKAE